MRFGDYIGSVDTFVRARRVERFEGQGGLATEWERKKASQRIEMICRMRMRELTESDGIH